MVEATPTMTVATGRTPRPAICVNVILTPSSATPVRKHGSRGEFDARDAAPFLVQK